MATNPSTTETTTDQDAPTSFPHLPLELRQKIYGHTLPISLSSLKVLSKRPSHEKDLANLITGSLISATQAQHLLHSVPDVGTVVRHLVHPDDVLCVERTSKLSPFDVVKLVEAVGLRSVVFDFRGRMEDFVQVYMALQRFLMWMTAKRIELKILVVLLDNRCDDWFPRSRGDREREYREFLLRRYPDGDKRRFWLKWTQARVEEIVTCSNEWGLRYLQTREEMNPPYRGLGGFGG